ncbi:hypothetical protein M426DRAFT_269096 [Hypoxylon sp. CI-4A]|nr:hypothetical protein M426DRAFT_269096 [Hypoxylon sp. CI-4A]
MASEVKQVNADEVEYALDSKPEAGPPFQSNINEAKLLWKIDLHVVPMLFIIYLAAFLDRVNISNALTMGLPEDLHLTGQQPNVALTLFFVAYVLLEIPSNLMMKRVGPRIWLTGCILAFGIIMLCQGFVQSYGGLLATRFLLGAAECGVFPGSIYLISFWYKKEESQKRFTVYWLSTILAGAFGGLLASAIAEMDGIRGLENWRWVFILEGIATVFVAIASWFFISDFPKEAKWLTEEERAFVLRKTESDEAREETPITVKDVAKFISTPKGYIGAIMYFSLLAPTYSITYFTPTIVRSLGYSTIQTQLHSVPPFAAAFGFAILLAYASDRLRIRSPFIFIGLAFLIAGLAMSMSFHGKAHFGVEYAGVCFAAMGSYGIGPIIVGWYVMNLQGHKERSIGTACMIGFGNAGSIIATFTFQSKDSPYYRTGYSICIAIAALCVAMSTAYAMLIWREKKVMAQRASEGDEMWHETYF